MFIGCAEKPYYHFNAYTDDMFLPSKDVMVYNNGGVPKMNYVNIGDVIIRGGDYSFRLRKTIDMAKSAGGDAIIVKGDKLGVNYESSTMVSLVIRFVNEQAHNAGDPDSNAEPGEYQDLDTKKQDYFLGDE
ncbi:MAG: hypothetical protein A2268_07730 [Candidatus Raymondbacteria bacterium RifOxyA12_full_50_37]|uniref:Uncharacterized protein n=1 Tax=Candidatus Raymondbacteria bacterium RIFOXYD12_FULL_49_13 TaxID=1817890 RepID=A0A1F7F5B8_UNCRA|nr:MAG: hypothetical protein A2248_05340 [Candidatus Raymondbacteria bacterium RIFOXYA2_FULL_49_16]OGJ90130.1 MAG: hypothetical protein A2268_07730 [Candidatus Raymondbacteria bacterium RifOxyA12_full_50_37]OGJ92123.1 MAG: hypothetical protein A2350_08620 [Candidatus Raymondbacteria bacterium RifOxyB12_full_50_8]OGJ97708.1 MAG: hypothetical protein A2453_09700 [Candidatus Raymondbacteria bacterium RIFOXYC2_FULL_50_21]OGK01727.1 MAG: hypothetical protein A2519_22915 [Candidatus Raymondbacteria b